jgi:hypothetical protein
VLDIVHLSLYCLVYNRTLAFPPGTSEKKSELLKPIPGPDGSYPNSAFCISRKFAWIPTDFAVSVDGKVVSALGYINNLHPGCTALYQALENTLTAFIPLFERVLTDVHAGNSVLARTRTVGSYSYADGKDYLSDDDDETVEARKERERSRPMKFPTVPTGGYPGGLDARQVKVNLKGRNIQVIVKLANIELVKVFFGQAHHTI